jgi:hypothetical protein
VEAKGLRPMVLRAHENLTDTVVIVGRGNNKQSPAAGAPTRVVFHPEIGDVDRLVDALASAGDLDAQFVTQGDHFTSLPHTFPRALKLAFELAGSKTGRPFTFNATIEEEHAACAALFPAGRKD